MKTIYLIRHAESTGQQPDAALRDLGKKQAQDMVARLRELSPDGAISSPYVRAMEII